MIVVSLAPNAYRIGVLISRNNIVKITAKMTINPAQFPKIFSALSYLFLPSAIDAKGAPPIPANALNAEINIIIGNVTPTPVKATSPYSGM